MIPIKYLLETKERGHQSPLSIEFPIAPAGAYQ